MGELSEYTNTENMSMTNQTEEKGDLKPL